MRSIELTSLADRELSDLQMARLEGGSASASSGGCGCACAYRDRGGSSIADNGVANALRYMFAHPAKYVEESYGLVFSYNGEMVVDGQYYPYNPIELE